MRAFLTTCIIPDYYNYTITRKQTCIYFYKSESLTGSGKALSPTLNFRLTLLHVHSSNLRHAQRAHIILSEPCFYAYFVEGMSHITRKGRHYGVLPKKVTKAYGAFSHVPRWQLDGFVTLSKRPQLLIFHCEDLGQQVFHLSSSLS